MSLARVGELNHNHKSNKTVSKETRLKMSVIHKGKTISNEVKEKTSKSLKSFSYKIKCIEKVCRDSLNELGRLDLDSYSLVRKKMNSSAHPKFIIKYFGSFKNFLKYYYSSEDDKYSEFRNTTD